MGTCFEESEVHRRRVGCWRALTDTVKYLHVQMTREQRHHTCYLLLQPVECSTSESHIRGSVGESVCDLCIRLVLGQYMSVRVLTNIRNVFENGALHCQLVQIRIQEGEDALRQLLETCGVGHSDC